MLTTVSSERPPRVPTSGDTLPQSAVQHRLAHWAYIQDDPSVEPWHREHLVRLRGVWEQANRAHYGGALVPPYMLLAEPSEPKLYGDCGRVSGFGGRSQVRLRPSLLAGTHPHMRAGAEHAEGRVRFVADVLLHETVHQWQQEVLGDQEPAYHGHGPRFRDRANEIGAALGLPPVRTMKRRGADKELPSCSQWPHNVRPVGYYLGAYRAPTGATTPAPVAAQPVVRNTVLCLPDLGFTGRLADRSVDVWNGSPPYNLADKFRGGGSVKSRVRGVYADSTGRGDGTYRPWPEYEAWQVRVLTEWHRTLADDGVIFYYTKAQHDGRRLHHPMEWIARTPLVLIDRLVWDRGGTPNVDTTRLLPTSEEVYLLARRPGVYLHNPGRTKNVVYLPPTNRRGKSGHPCPTPRELVRTCLSLVKRPRDGRRLLVADCYGGTGTTGLVARELGMDYLLGDISPGYVEKAEWNLALPIPSSLLHGVPPARELRRVPTSGDNMEEAAG